MKKMKKFTALLAVTAMLAALPGCKVMTASAQTPTTFCVAYDSDDGEWYYQRDSSTWNDNIERKEAFQLKDVISNGDIVVVEGGSGNGLKLDISNVRLSNLTFKEASTVIVTTAGVDACYVLNGSVAAVNGDVAKAEVYDRSSVTFNNNVTDLKVIGTGHGAHAYVGSGGTVGHVLAVDENHTLYEYYDVAAGMLNIEDGSFRTDSAYYSETPSAASGSTQPAQPAVQNPAPAAQPAPAPAASSAGEYDDVPKTGEEAPIYLWLIGFAAVCFAGKLVLKKV